MQGFTITKDGQPTSGQLFLPNGQDDGRFAARETLALLRTEWPGEYDDHQIATARITTEPSPEELMAAKEAVYVAALEGRITIRERMDRIGELEDRAADMIRAWVKCFRTTPAIALLRIADMGSQNADDELLRAIREVLDCTDPEDVESVFDAAHTALDAYRDTHWSREWMRAAE